MFSSLADIIKIPAALLIGAAVSALIVITSYEGLRLPLIGQVIDGRVASKVNAATENMVTKFERDALQAQLDRERRDRQIAEAAMAKAQERADATEIARQTAEKRISELQEQAKQDGLDGWSKEELEWIAKH